MAEGHESDDQRERRSGGQRGEPGGQGPSGPVPGGRPHVGPPAGGVERPAVHRLGPPLRPMLPDGRTESFRTADTGFVDRVRGDRPVDMIAVRRDDELLDAVASGGTVATETQAEYEIASLLADWRDEIVTMPVPQHPTLEQVLATAQRRPPVRRFQVIAGAAAAFVAVVVGGTVFVQRSSPGDPLWSVKEVMFAQQASQTLVTSEAKVQLGQASAALDSGNQAGVATALAKVRAKVDTVRDPKVKADLEQQVRKLAAAAGLPTDTSQFPTLTSTPRPRPLPDVSEENPRPELRSGRESGERRPSREHTTSPVVTGSETAPSTEPSQTREPDTRPMLPSVSTPIVTTPPDTSVRTGPSAAESSSAPAPTAPPIVLPAPTGATSPVRTVSPDLGQRHPPEPVIPTTVPVVPSLPLIPRSDHTN